MTSNKALFLDRDGVINIEHGYVYRQENFHFQEGIFELCRAAQALGYLLVIVTNQAGIARGYYTESEFLDLTTWMIGEFAAQQIHVARVYYCPYHPVYGIGAYRRDSPNRKPKPGMLLRAQEDLDLNLSASLLIGDQISDIQAAEAAGVGARILLCSKATGSGLPEDCYLSESLDEIRDRFFRPVNRTIGAGSSAYPRDERSVT